MIKVFAINGSPRLERGRTALILNPFLKGAKDAGADVELFYSNKLKIKPCTGCFFCWDEKPGVCPIKDDMQILYPKLRSTDILVLATPVYVPLPGDFQNFLNRTIPLMNPVLRTTPDERTRIIFHKDVKISKIVLVSTCGWWEKGNFGTVIRIAEEFAKDASVEFAGAVLRPHSDYLFQKNEKTKKILENCKLAGYQLVKEGKMHPETLKAIGSPLVSRRNYME
jgi:multimeric flavodoxin WrbA